MGKKVMLAIPLFLGREAASLGQLEVNCGGRRKERETPQPCAEYPLGLEYHTGALFNLLR